MARRFATLDVFTAEPLAGNPLAVVLDAEGLDDGRMQAIAREFNLSETVFVRPSGDARQRASIRIFTPTRELPFAGHPTVGTAVLLALLDRTDEPKAVAFGLREEIGVVPCVAEVEGEGRGYARFRLPRLPEVWGEGRDVAACASGLGLESAEIGFDRHRPSRHSAGVPYDLVPVVSIEALARGSPRGHAFETAFGVDGRASAYLYARRLAPGPKRFRARMFSHGLGIKEDPATGSAAAAFAGALMQFEPMGEGTHDVLIEQGYEMGRPSEIELQLVIENGALVAAEIGGRAVVVGRGEILL
jgi:trans-2,3-dihydro-3-hydroxyanthranilate isomerase